MHVEPDVEIWGGEYGTTSFYRGGEEVVWIQFVRWAGQPHWVTLGRAFDSYRSAVRAALEGPCGSPLLTEGQLDEVVAAIGPPPA